MGIADDGGRALAVGGVHGADEGAVAECGTLVADGEESAVGGIAGIRAGDVDGDDDVLVEAGAAADVAHAADVALCALDGAVDNEVADGRVVDHLEEGHAVVRDVVADRNPMALAVEDALKGVLLVALVGREGVAADHDVGRGVGAEVDVGRQAGVDLLLAVVDEGGKPVEVGGRAELIVAVGRQRLVVSVGRAAVLADALDELVGVAVRLVRVREGQLAALRRAVAVEVAHGIDHAVRREGHGVHVLSERLIPDDVVRLAAVDLIGDGAGRQVILVLADERALIAVGVVVVSALAPAVAPERVGAVHADDEAGVVAVLDDGARVADPSAEGCRLAGAGDAARVEAVAHDDAAGAVHADAADAGRVLVLGADGGLVAAVLEGDGAAAVGAAGNASDEGRAADVARPVHDDVLDHGAAVEHAEESDVFLLRQVDREAHDVVLLAVEGAAIGARRGADGRERGALHVDVGGEHGVGRAVAAGHVV